MQMRANNAKEDKRGTHLTFPTNKWNVVNTNVMSCLAPNCNF